MFSAAASDKPYITPEPKGQKRQDFISRLAPKDVTYHQEVQALIYHALQCVPSGQLWCHPRVETSSVSDTCELCPVESPSPSLPVVLSPLPNRFHSNACVQNCIVSNNGCTTSLTIADVSYVIPARCRFIWATIEHGSKILDELSERPYFDIVLMDPPWPNRSVRNAGNYATMSRHEPDVFHEAIRTAKSHCSPSGYIAIWITNKHAIRSQVLDHMTAQGFVLAEEWFWLKVTSKGEPVTVLDGVWRKPYEILLLFRQNIEFLNPQRRVVFAVPDVHSRKPNLKQLFEMVFESGPTLELFARNLTAGWWSLGNEVLKFQNHKAWHTTPD